MSHVCCVKKRKKGKHLTFEEREELEALIINNNKKPEKDRLSQRKIAKHMGISPATLSRELKRGRVILRDAANYVSYSSLKAQDDYDEKAKAKGPHLKIGKNYELAEKIEDMIINRKYSPFAAIQKLKNDPSYKKTPISVRTLYNYIDNEHLANVTKKDLPRKGKSSK